MKRSLIIVLTLVVIAALVLVGATFAMGMLTEKAIMAYSGELEDSATLSAVDLSVDQYERGFGKSTFDSTLVVEGIDEAIPLEHEVYHGPFALTPDGPKAGYSYVISTVDIEALPDEIRENIQSVYGDTEPFTIKTTIELDGDRQSHVSIAPIDHEDDEMTLRFDGGEIEFLGDSGASNVNGNIEFSPLSLKMKAEEGGDFRMRFDGASGSLSAEENGTIVMDGALSKINIKGGAKGPVGFTIESVDVKANYLPVEGIEGIVEGTASVTIPSVEIDAAEKGKFVASGLKIANETSSESGDLLKYRVTYGADSFKADMVEQTEDLAWLKMLESGAEVSLFGTVPHAIAHELANFQQERNGIATSPEAIAENSLALAEMMEAVLRKLNKGSGIGLDARVGPKDGGVNLNLNIDYEEERPITSRKNYQELLNALNLNLSAKVPKTMLDATPALEEQLAGLKAMGTVKETLSGYEASLTAERGKVNVNGEPNPMFEQMAPMLMMAIEWEAIFEGMRMAAEAQATAAAAAEEE